MAYLRKRQTHSNVASIRQNYGINNIQNKSFGGMHIT